MIGIEWVGAWRHYRGGRYLVIALAETHAHNGDIDVVYYSLREKHNVTRPLKQDSRKQDSWTDMVKWPDGQTRRRFVREAEYPQGFFDTLFDAHIAGAS